MTNNKEKLKKEILEELDKEFPFWSTKPKRKKWAILASRREIKRFISSIIDRIQKETLKEIVEIFDNMWGSYDPSKSKLGFDGQFKKKLKKL